jgi:hypothetical protein
MCFAEPTEEAHGADPVLLVSDPIADAVAVLDIFNGRGTVWAIPESEPGGISAARGRMAVVSGRRGRVVNVYEGGGRVWSPVPYRTVPLHLGARPRSVRVTQDGLRVAVLCEQHSCQEFCIQTRAYLGAVDACIGFRKTGMEEHDGGWLLLTSPRSTSECTIFDTSDKSQPLTYTERNLVFSEMGMVPGLGVVIHMQRSGARDELRVYATPEEAMRMSDARAAWMAVAARATAHRAVALGSHDTP